MVWMPRKKTLKKKNDLGMRAKPVPDLDVACETCTVDGCRRRAEGSHCTQWAHTEQKRNKEWTIVVEGRPLTEEEKKRHREQMLLNNIRTIRRRGWT